MLVQWLHEPHLKVPVGLESQVVGLEGGRWLLTKVSWRVGALRKENMGGSGKQEARAGSLSKISQFRRMIVVTSLDMELNGVVKNTREFRIWGRFVLERRGVLSRDLALFSAWFRTVGLYPLCLNRWYISSACWWKSVSLSQILLSLWNWP